MDDDAERRRAEVQARCTRGLSPEPLARRAPKQVLERLAAAVSPECAADRYGGGSLLASFERRVADLLGKPAAVFMPSGTMAQQIALRIWSDRKSVRTVAFHPKCHLELYEEKGYARLHGLAARIIGAPNALLTRADLDGVVEPIAALLLELPQREIGGQLPTWDELLSQVAWARDRGVSLHVDGARLWETQPFYGRPLRDIAALFDSVYVSVYKILGGIAGCVLAGPEDFVRQARVWQRRHGGTLPAVYPFVLAAEIGLDTRLARIELYHRKAREIAAHLLGLEGVRIMPNPPHTNMMHVLLPGDVDALERAGLEVAEASGVWLYGKLARTDVPGFARLELTCTEATLELSNDEIVSLLGDVVRRARGESG